MAEPAPLLVSPSSSLISKCIFVDTTVFIGGDRNALAEFNAKRLPGARFLHLPGIANKDHPLGLGNMLPTPEGFASACRDLGITPNDHVILYDAQGIFSSPRALVMFRVFGHDSTSVLDGGLPAWEAAGLPLETAPFTAPSASTYPTPQYNQSLVVEFSDVIAHVSKDPQSITEIVLDARPSDMYAKGHMPNSISLPASSFLEKKKTSQGTEYTTYKTQEEMKSTLVNAIGPERAEHIIQGKFGAITSCRSGMTAATIWLGLKLLGSTKLKFYDESWEGYCKRSEAPVLQ